MEMEIMSDNNDVGYIDAHCHLPKNRFKKEWDQNITTWSDIGIKVIIGVSMTKNESLKMIQLANSADFIIPAIGIHPWKVKNDINPNELYQEFDEIIQTNEKIRVIGEVGLDYRFVEKIDRYPFQRKAFDVFTQLARDYDLILSIHCVNATEDVIGILRKNAVPSRQCIFHWYSGTDDELKQVLEYEPYFSITPAIEYSESHQNTARKAPISRLLTESDGDVKYKTGIRGTPEIIPQVIENLAKIRGKDPEDLKYQIWDNFNSLLQR